MLFGGNLARRTRYIGDKRWQRRYHDATRQYHSQAVAAPLVSVAAFEMHNQCLSRASEQSLSLGSAASNKYLNVIVSSLKTIAMRVCGIELVIKF